MAPIRSYTSWNSRPSNDVEQIEPYKHYYFICEGQNTEKWYFEKLIDLKKEFSIPSSIDVEYLEKTDEHKTWSNPKKLIELSRSIRANGSISFDSKHDVMILVFDTDIYEKQDEKVYAELLADASMDNMICVTNPNFELYLLLHYDNSYDEVIAPNEKALLENDWVSIDGEKIRYSEYLFRNKSGLKPKQDATIAELARNVRTAIAQEKRLNNDAYQCRGKITSNIGMMLDTILKDKGITDNLS